jgi:hypothetical protein
MAVRLARSPEERAQQEAAAVLAQVPEELRPGPEQDEATRWMADPSRLLRVCDAAVPRLVALPAATPSLRLLADQTAELLRGVSPALTRLGQPDGISPSRMAEMLEVDKAGPNVRC